MDQNKKTECSFHYRRLKVVVSTGAEITKVYRIFNFRRDYVRRDCIDLNTEMRAIAKSQPERDSFKLKRNALFGNTFESFLKQMEAKILKDEFEILKSVSKPTFEDIYRYRGTALIEF